MLAGFTVNHVFVASRFDVSSSLQARDFLPPCSHLQLLFVAFLVLPCSTIGVLLSLGGLLASRKSIQVLTLKTFFMDLWAKLFGIAHAREDGWALDRLVFKAPDSSTSNTL